MANTAYIRNQQFRFQKLLLQQLLARRFSIEEPALFAQMKQIHREVESQFDIPFPETKRRFFPRQQVFNWTAAWLGLLGFRGGREALKTRDSGRISYYLGSELLEQIAEDSLYDALNASIPLLDKFDIDFNYFEHCGLFPITALCPGELLATEYSKKSALPLPESTVTVDGYRDEKEFRWFHRWQDCAADVKTALFLSHHPWRHSSEKTSIKLYQARDYGPNSRFLGDRNALYFAVYLDSAPTDIDAALRAFRLQLEDELNFEHAGVIPNFGAYSQTDFARSVERENLVFKQNQMLFPAILGMWCWDLVRADGKGSSVYSARQKIEEHLMLQGLHVKVPKLQHLNEQFEKIRELIESPQSGLLDRVLSRTMSTRLGRR